MMINIRMDYKEIGTTMINLLELAFYKDHWRALVNEILTSVIVEIYQISFCVFVCAFPPEISSFSGKSFPFLFPFFLCYPYFDTFLFMWSVENKSELIVISGLSVCVMVSWRPLCWLFANH